MLYSYVPSCQQPLIIMDILAATAKESTLSFTLIWGLFNPWLAMLDCEHSTKWILWQWRQEYGMSIRCCWNNGKRIYNSTWNFKVFLYLHAGSVMPDPFIFDRIVTCNTIILEFLAKANLSILTQEYNVLCRIIISRIYLNCEKIIARGTAWHVGVLYPHMIIIINKLQ